MNPSGVYKVLKVFCFFKISETLDISSKQLGEMFEGDSADTNAGNFPFMSMGCRMEGPKQIF